MSSVTPITTPQQHLQDVLNWSVSINQRTIFLHARLRNLENQLGMPIDPDPSRNNLSNRITHLQLELAKRRDADPSEADRVAKFQKTFNASPSQYTKTQNELREFKQNILDHNQVVSQTKQTGEEFFTAYTIRTRNPYVISRIIPKQMMNIIINKESPSAGTLSVKRTFIDVMGIQCEAEDRHLCYSVALDLGVVDRGPVLQPALKDILEENISKTTQFSIIIYSDDGYLEIRDLNYYTFKILSCYWQSKPCDIFGKIPPEHLPLLLQPSIFIKDGVATVAVNFLQHIFLCLHPKVFSIKQLAAFDKNIATLVVPALVERLKSETTYNSSMIIDAVKILRIMKEANFPLNFAELITYADDLISNFLLTLSNETEFPDLSSLDISSAYDSTLYKEVLAKIKHVQTTFAKSLLPKKVQFKYLPDPHTKSKYIPVEHVAK